MKRRRNEDVTDIGIVAITRCKKKRKGVLFVFRYWSRRGLSRGWSFIDFAICVRLVCDDYTKTECGEESGRWRAVTRRDANRSRYSIWRDETRGSVCVACVVHVTCDTCTRRAQPRSRSRSGIPYCVDESVRILVVLSHACCTRDKRGACIRTLGAEAKCRNCN